MIILSLIVFYICMINMMAQKHDNDDICSYTSPSGQFLIQKNNSHTIHHIDIGNSSSIIHLELTIANNSILAEDINIKINDGNITMLWKLQNGNTAKNQSYISQSSSLNLTFSYSGKWRTDLMFAYEEVTFEIYIRTKTDDTGIYESDASHARPNSATILNLNPREGVWNESSVFVTVHMMNMPEDDGDYMLIGAGNEPFEGPPAAMLTGLTTETTKYYIASSEIHIMLFHISRKEPKFKISWLRNGNKIQEPDYETDSSIPDSALQAMPICFYNASWIEEFNSTEDENKAFFKFQEKFADVANRYIKDNNLNSMHVIRPQNVMLQHISSILEPDSELENGAIYAMITIVGNYDDRMAVFRWYQLQEVIDAYEAHDESMGYHLGFKVGKCAVGTNYKWWYLAMVLTLLLYISFFLVVWIIAYKIPRKSMKYQNIHKLTSESQHTLYSPRNNIEDLYAVYDNPSMNTDEEGDEDQSAEEPNRQNREDSIRGNDNWILKRNDEKLKQVEMTLQVPKHEERFGRLWRKHFESPSVQRTILVEPTIHNDPEESSLEDFEVTNF